MALFISTGQTPIRDLCRKPLILGCLFACLLVSQIPVWRMTHCNCIEFTGENFQTLLQNCHIRDLCTTAKNPQSNDMCERMHKMVGNVLRTLLHGEPPQHMASTKEYINKALSIIMHAMIAEIHSTLGSSSRILHSTGTCSLIWGRLNVHCVGSYYSN
jgi:hypothetical protein